MDRPQVQRRRFGRTEGHPRERRAVAGGPNWTIRRLRAKIKARADQPFAVVQGAAKKLSLAAAPAPAERASAARWSALALDDVDGLSSTASKCHNGGRVRKSAIVALARKLIVALWKYVTSGVVIDGAVTAVA